MDTKITTAVRAALGAALACAAFAACSPKFDWRDFRSTEAPYAVLFPAKPATHTRSINLGGATVNMQMAAAEVDGVTFAVGAAEMADPAQALAAAGAMKTAMVANINGTVTAEKQTGKLIEVDAKGTRNGEALRMVGRFIANDKRVYQLIVVGKEKHMPNDEIEMFMRSFKPN